MNNIIPSDAPPSEFSANRFLYYCQSIQHDKCAYTKHMQHTEPLGQTLIERLTSSEILFSTLCHQIWKQVEEQPNDRNIV
jgi:hypothetical protein